MNAPGPDVWLIASGGPPDITDRPREGPFDVHHDRQCSATSPQLLQETQGCLFQMTSHGVESERIREKTPCQPPCSCNTTQDIIELASSTAAGDVAVPDFIRRAAGSPRAAAVPVQCCTASDAIV